MIKQAQLFIRDDVLYRKYIWELRVEEFIRGYDRQVGRNSENYSVRVVQHPGEFHSPESQVMKFGCI